PGAKVNRRTCTSLPTATGSIDLTLYPAPCVIAPLPRSFNPNNGPEHDRQHCGFQPEEERGYRRDIAERGSVIATSLRRGSPNGETRSWRCPLPEVIRRKYTHSEFYRP